VLRSTTAGRRAVDEENQGNRRLPLCLLDKGYVSPVINDYVDMIGRKAIIDRKAYKGWLPNPLDPASQNGMPHEPP
jgi:hypothetical protein